MTQYKPQFTITDEISRLKSKILKQEKSGVKAHIHATDEILYNAHVRSVHSTLAVENPTFSLTLAEVEDIIGNQYVSCSHNEIRAVQNAYAAYTWLDIYHPPNPYSATDLLHAHSMFMAGFTKEAGSFRPDNLIPRLIDNLLDWVKTSDEHPLIKSCVFHYEVMHLRPFGAGNGLVARLWHILLLYLWRMPMGLRLANYICMRKEEYFAALAIADKAVGCTKFIEFMLQAIRDAIMEYDRTYG